MINFRTLPDGRHFKGEFRITKRGTELAQSPGRLFAELIPFFVLEIDHASYSRFEERPFGKWDVWMNVINVEVDRTFPRKPPWSKPLKVVHPLG